MSKIPSDRSIRGALTTLKKAGIINIAPANIYRDFDTWEVLSKIPTKYLSPKKSLKKRLPKQKKVVNDPNHGLLNI